MKRVIVDYLKIPEDILQKLVEKYPNGYNNRDIITFTDPKNKRVEAVELKTEDTCYLIKVSSQLVDKMDDFVLEEEEEDDFIEGIEEDIDIEEISEEE